MAGLAGMFVAIFIEWRSRYSKYNEGNVGWVNINFDDLYDFFHVSLIVFFMEYTLQEF